MNPAGEEDQVVGEVRVYVLHTTSDLKDDWFSEPVGDVAYAYSVEARAAWERAYRGPDGIEPEIVAHDVSSEDFGYHCARWHVHIADAAGGSAGQWYKASDSLRAEIVRRV
jgi:hypothetical protein